MKTDVETLSPTRVRLTVEVPFDELKPSVDAAYRKVAREVRVPGFRPGKVPPPIIDRRFGRGVVLEQAVSDAMPDLYGKAVEENEVYVLGQPQLEITRLDDGKELAFTAEVDIRPDIEVPDYDGVPVTVEDAEVTPDDVEEQLSTLQERFAVLKGVDTAAKDGDYVSIDLAATSDGEPLEDAQASGLSYQVGEGSLVDGLDDALRGMSAGDTATFSTTLAGGEHAGEEAEVTVTVHSVKEKELPALDDEFAQMASEFDAIGELRSDIRSRLERAKRSQQADQAREQALDKLLGRVEIPLPDSVVAEEVERRSRSFDQQLESAGLSREDFFAAQQKGEADFDKELAEDAERSVRAGFLLDAVAMKEEISVEEPEVREQLVQTAIRMGVAPDQLAERLSQTGQVGLVVAEVLRGKALSRLAEHAKITDGSGRQVDYAELREAENPPTAEEELEGEIVEDEADGTDEDEGAPAEEAGQGRAGARSRG